MIITIKNFGPIREMSFDLDKDLHIIFGKNAIGKSYGTYCVYCILKSIKYKLRASRYDIFNGKFGKYLRDIADDVILISKNSKGNYISINAVFEQLILKLLNTTLSLDIQNSFQNTFSLLSNLQNQYAQENYSITFSFKNNELITLGSTKEGKPIFDYIKLNTEYGVVLADTETVSLALYINHKKEIEKSKEIEFALELVKLFLDKFRHYVSILNADIRDIYYLPASRSGLYQALRGFTPIIAALTQNRFFIQNRTIELPSLSEPLSDYFIDLSTLNKKNINQDFYPLIDEIEAIIGGTVHYNDKTQNITFKPNQLSIELDLSEASSMVAELSPIIIYLKHIVNHKLQPNGFEHFFEKETINDRFDMLFIEEPEAHLHPEVQVKLMRIFTKLIEYKIKVVMTSHSNYMFNKLNNLILSNKISPQKINVQHLVKRHDGSVTNVEMSATEEGIYDSNFTDVSKALYEERIQIFEQNNS